MPRREHDRNVNLRTRLITPNHLAIRKLLIIRNGYTAYSKSVSAFIKSNIIDVMLLSGNNLSQNSSGKG